MTYLAFAEWGRDPVGQRLYLIKVPMPTTLPPCMHCPHVYTDTHAHLYCAHLFLTKVSMPTLSPCMCMWVH